MNRINSNKSTVTIIAIISVIIPVAVAVLIYLPQKQNFLGEWVNGIPAFNAFINTLTSILLLSALVAIKQGNIKLHRALMTAAFVVGAVFLVSYILYHLSVPSTMFGDLNKDGELSDPEKLEAGNLRYAYYFVLLSHILLSIVVVPLVLMAFYFALTEKIEKHKKIVKFTFPIWLYVSVTGVLTYLLISPYY
ncbi:MAG: DUF420 domain-containing protein [Cyclobacteriaceae bacterium]